jgi:hypothetical protein
MELIKQHIQTNIVSFLNEPSTAFSEVFDNIQFGNKLKEKRFLSYLDNIIDKGFTSKNNEDLQILHIHFDNNFNDSSKLFIAEYLLIKMFKLYQSNDNITDETNDILQKAISTIEAKQNNLEAKCPDGASGKNGGNKIWKQWIQDKNNYKLLLLFHKSLNSSSSLKTKTLFNTQINFCRSITHLFELRPYAIELGDLYKSYNLLNTNKTINTIDENNSEIIDELETIILFDCERKKIMINFSLEEIKKWNSDYGTNFKKYLIFTFGKESHSFNNIRNKIDVIRERFKIPIETTYTILSSEIDILLNKQKKNSIQIEFIGFETSSFWDTFLLETSIRDLYELKSIKLMNIYSLCLTEEIKNYILEDLFSKSESSELISFNTKQALLECRDDDVNLIKEALANTLNLIINSEIKSIIKKQLDNIQTIILDEAIIKNPKLTSIFSNALTLAKSIILKTWADIPSLTSNSIVILSYRDQGKYPNYFYPNLVECEFHKEVNGAAILLGFFFSQNYNWSKYYLLKDYHKYLNHHIRQNYFGWNQLKSTIQAIRPESKLNIDWNLEYEFSNTDQRETYKVKIKDQKVKTFNSSDLFIVKIGENLNYQVGNMDYLLSLDITDGKYFIQNLDEIQEDINIYDKIADTKQQEEELNIIRKKFKLDDESAGRLWKILLKTIADSKGEDNLYNDLRIHLEKKRLKIVSLFHFKNSWINPQSESIAPLSKRIFIELCEYLNIPKIYFVIIQRIRNASKQSSRQSTRQMNQLLKDLFNDGCFDNDKNARAIINNRLAFYKLNHPLDELGIDENYLADNLVTLTELIQPELKLLELETIEKIEQ